MSPALVEYPLRDIKLFFVNDKVNQCTYWLKPAIYSRSIKLTDLVRKCKPGCKIPDDPLYWNIYRRVKRLEKLGYVTLEHKTRVDWDKTNETRMNEIQTSVQSIFASACEKNPPPFSSTGTLTGDTEPKISTVKITESAFTVVPTKNLFTLLCRVQNSNRFFESAKSKGEWGQLKADLGMSCAQLKAQRRKCPYYLSSRTRGTRIDAVFRLRRMRKHSYFRRRDKRVVNPEVVHELEYIQGKFDQYVNDIEDLKCCMVNKEDGSIKLLDYQTRFTDESRKSGTIARFYRTWEKAGESYNTAVFLTLTSFPPSEATKHQHRASLWHVNRHFAVAWNAYLSLMQKRKRAARRDELLDTMRNRVAKIRSYKIDKEGKLKLTREERNAALQPMHEENYRPKYLQVYEFQKNGMIHGHCVIFGSQWLDKFEQIKQDWVRLGQGERIHVYALHKEGDVWSWSKQAPQDSRNRQPVDYLMKYLGKGVRLSSSHGMYWAVNKRFFTNSRALLHDHDLPVEYEKMPARYDFLGTIKGTDIPSWLSRVNVGNLRRTTLFGNLDPLGWAPENRSGAREALV